LAVSSIGAHELWFGAWSIEVSVRPLYLIDKMVDGPLKHMLLACAGKEAGIRILAWSLERSGPLTDGGGWYCHSVSDTISGGGDYYQVLDVLAQQVGASGVFSDWPATVSYYASCMGLE
ncbi:MAG: hypothetical protein AB7E55_29540, partial [Pigmentiphaga sp.]